MSHMACGNLDIVSEIMDEEDKQWITEGKGLAANIVCNHLLFSISSLILPQVLGLATFRISGFSYIQLNAFDGTLLAPQYVVSMTPNMLPTTAVEWDCCYG